VTPDGGATWNNISSSFYLPQNFTFKEIVQFDIQESGGLLCAAIEVFYPNGIATMNLIEISSDHGNTWTAYQVQYFNEFDMEISELNANTVFWGGRDMIYKYELQLNTICTPSNISQRNSRNQSDWVHADHRMIKSYLNGTNSEVWLCANDGGLSQSFDNGGTWFYQNQNHSLNNLHFYGMGNSVSGDYIVAGAQDCGIFMFKKDKWNINEWKNAIYYDGRNCMVDLENESIFYGQGSPASRGFLSCLFKTTDYGQTWNSENAPYKYHFTPDQEWDMNIGPCPNNPNAICTTYVERSEDGRRPMYMHPVSKKVYTAYHEVYVSSNKAVSWQAIGSLNVIKGTYDPSITAMAVAESDENYIYVGYRVDPPPEVMFRCTNALSGTPTWLDITSNLSALQNRGVRTIVVDPNDKSKVFVGLDGMRAFSTSNSYNTVFYSTDAGNTRVAIPGQIGNSNINLSFPNLELYDLELDAIGNRLYADFQNGIYYFDLSNLNNPNATWSRFMTSISGELPSVPVSDIDIVYSKGVIRAATYGRGIWESPLPCPSYLSKTMDQNDAILIQNVGVINWQYSNYIIPSGYTLTIDNTTLKMPQNARFTIQKGGKLVIKNGAKITNGADNCAYMWDGIYVEADANLPQIPNAVTGLYPDHGFLVLENCTLEHAYMAVSAGYNNPGGSGLQGGGVILAEGSTFMNNRFSARFYDFTFSNKSRVRDCNFKCTGSLPYFSDNDGAYSFVSLFGIKDMWLSGNTFENSAPGGDDNPFGSKFRGAGIISVNSTYWVTPSFNPSLYNGNCTVPNGVRTTFKGLTHGVFIYNFNNDPSRQAHILDCDFTDISMGIGMNWDTKTQVYGNRFNWTTNFDEYPYFSYPNSAIKTDYAEGFTLDKNQIDFQYPEVITGIHGISINESHPNLSTVFPVTVYQNVIVNANTNGSNNIGLAIFDDVNNGGDNNTLQFQCNTFTGFNLAVSSNAVTGIPDQGTSTMPAGNKFTDPCTQIIRLDAPVQALTNYGPYYYESNNPVEEVLVPSSCNPNWKSLGVNNHSNLCPPSNNLTYYCIEGQNGGGDVEYSIRNNFDPFTDALRLIQAGNYAGAQSLLPQISNQGEHNLVDFSLNLYLGGSNYFLLSASQREQLTGIMQNGNEKVKQTIRNILLAYTDKPVMETFTHPASASYQAMKNKTGTAAGRQAQCSVYPNPAQGSFNVRFALPDGVTEGRVVVRDIFGKIVWAQAIHTIMGELQVNLPGTNAIYLCSIEGNNRTLFTTKVLINR
jgi:hypothetical protein